MANNRRWTQDRLKLLGLLRAGGVPMKEIGAIMGVSTNHLEIAVTRYPEMMPPRTHLFQGLQPEIVEWLIRITPDGAAIADTVRSILTDAYNDETA